MWRRRSSICSTRRSLSPGWRHSILNASTLDFVLPPQLEARQPAELRGRGRDDVRLMVSNRATGEIAHAQFRDMPRFLRRGDLLVLNTTATMPASLRAGRENGEEIALHYSTSLPGDLAVVEPRIADVVAGERLVLHAGVASLEQHERPYEEWYEVPLRTAERIRATHERGGRVIAVGTTVVRALESSLDAHGNVIASRGWTDLVITSSRGLKVVD